MRGSTSCGRRSSGQRKQPNDLFVTILADPAHRFKVTEVAFMMDWDDSGSSSDDDTDVISNVTKAVSQMGSGENQQSTTRSSMRGLQLAIQEGWLVQRARDMCSFAHDRYRQAAQAEAAALPEGSVAKMSFRIIMMMMHEPIPDIYRIAEHAKQ